MKCFSESYLTEEVYLISFGGKGSNSTPSPKDKGHSLGGQLERAGLGEKVEFCKKSENNTCEVTALAYSVVLPVNV